MMFWEAVFGPQAWLRRRLVLASIVGLSGAGALGFIMGRQPLLAAGALVVLFLALATLAQPDIPTLIVIFILYTNAAVVAVRFYKVPVVVGASVPALLIIPFAYYLIVRRQKLIAGPVTFLMVLLLLVQSIGTLLSAYFAISFGALLTFATEGAGLYFLITNTVQTLPMLRRVIWVLLLAGAFLGFLSFFQQVTYTYNNNYGGFAQMSNAAFGTGAEQLQGAVTQKRLAGPVGDQNYYAQFMLMLVPVGLFQFWSEKSKLKRALAVIATGLIISGVALTFSRGAAVGFVLMLVSMAFLRYLKLKQLLAILLGIVVLLQAFPQYGFRLMSLQQLSTATDQSAGGLTNADNSTQSRVTEMLTAGRVFLDYPVFGVGPGVFKYYYPHYVELVGGQLHAGVRAAHNLYLEIAAESGAFGLISFLGIVFLTIRNLARTRRRYLQSHPELANMATGFILAIVTYLTAGLFLSLAYERYFWLMVALAGATSCIADTAALGGPAPADRSAENATLASSPAMKLLS